MIRIGSLFSGIGGLELGIEVALAEVGIPARVLWQVEIDPFCRSVLARHWPEATRYEDVRSVTGMHRPECDLDDDCWSSDRILAPVDLICGGFPCQDIALPGNGAGLAGERSGLWRDYARLVRELRPRFVVIENVAALLSRGIGTVLGDLAEAGYDAEWTCVRAADVGAPHGRERLFVVAYAHGEGFQRIGTDDVYSDEGVDEQPGHDADGCGAARGGGSATQQDRAWIEGAGQSGMVGSADGLPCRMVLPGRWPNSYGSCQETWEPPRVVERMTETDRARRSALGNAVVPHVAHEAARRLLVPLLRA